MDGPRRADREFHYQGDLLREDSDVDGTKSERSRYGEDDGWRVPGDVVGGGRVHGALVSCRGYGAATNSPGGGQRAPNSCPNDVARTLPVKHREQCAGHLGARSFRCTAGVGRGLTDWFEYDAARSSTKDGGLEVCYAYWCKDDKLDVEPGITGIGCVEEQVVGSPVFDTLLLVKTLFNCEQSVGIEVSNRAWFQLFPFAVCSLAYSRGSCCPPEASLLYALRPLRPPATEPAHSTF
ncbi:hypothetical protein GOBAR_AA23492 [Gossypium barbadense]|uniref:Uncharacterized protein n=1 Tax=Gossypium barbadense TaxID=3634 RepID=A0A2P5X1F0_GOSBA|nr:hypothetical protein GOBAR_AA23492 [Gossypium barbadense]